MLICYWICIFYFWLEATGTDLIRRSLSLLMAGRLPGTPSLPVLYFTFPVLSPSLTHNSWNTAVVFSPYFLKFLLLSYSNRNLAVFWGHSQPGVTFVSVFLRLGQVSSFRHSPSLPLLLKLTSSVYTIKCCDLSTIVVILSWFYYWFIVTLVLLS